MKALKMKCLSESDELLDLRTTRSRPDRTLHHRKTEYIGKVLECIDMSNVRQNALRQDWPNVVI